VDIEVGWDLAVDRGEKPLELDRAMASVQAADHLAGGDVQDRVWVGHAPHHRPG
jgi:hypothetical protein